MRTDAALVDLPCAKIVSGDCSGNDLGPVFGLAWLIGGAVWLAASGPNGPWGLPGWLCPAAAIYYGLLHVPAWWRSHIEPRRILGASRAQIAPGTIRPGERFAFHFTQRMGRLLQAHVVVSFVLRETVVIGLGEGERTERQDHLIQSYDAREARIERGEQLVLDCGFDVPSDSGRSLRTGDWPISWVVKISMTPKRGLQLWQEIELPFREDSAGIRVLEPEAAANDCFALVLTQFRLPSISTVVQAVQTVAPHLTSEQAIELLSKTPLPQMPSLVTKLVSEPVAPTGVVVLATGLSRTDAESARVRLEAAGATVEVRQGGRALPAPSGQRYPIPHALPGAASEALPLPSDETPSEG